MPAAATPLFMLDTDVCSYLIRGQSAALEDRIRNSNPDLLCISVITRAELLYGVERKPEAKRLGQLVNALLVAVRVLPWEVGAASRYASIRTRLEAEGAPIGMADMMIAAHAVDVGAVLVTNNTRHYARIKESLFEYVNWTEGKRVARKAGRQTAKK
jgi:tRNA(fMet)-specific endonuclease VapC